MSQPSQRPLRQPLRPSFGSRPGRPPRSRGPLLAALGGVTLLGLAPPPARAFSEDLCVDSTQPPGRRLYNCLDSNCGPNAENHALCRANAVYGAAAAMQGTARSLLHTDATFALAQAVGFRADVAYWLAAYDEAVDVAAYQPFDMYGNAVPAGYATSPRVVQVSDPRTTGINGWQRTLPDTGGFGYHFPALFHFPPGSSLGQNPSYTVNGEEPQLQDSVYEGMLYQARRWALFGARACVNGFTQYDPVARSYFTGAGCYYGTDPNHSDPPVNKWLTGLMPSLTVLGGAPFPFSAYSGDAIAAYDLQGTGPMASAVAPFYYAQGPQALTLAQKVSTSGGRVTLAGATQPVPLPIVKMAIYLHILQDRISHAKCGDRSTVTKGDGDLYFSFTYDTQDCTQDVHAVRHYEELGWPIGQLPRRDYTALQYTWDELVQFAAQHGGDGYLARSLSPSQLAAARLHWIGDPDQRAQHPGLIPGRVLTKRDACLRLKEMIDVIAEHPEMQEMPGNSPNTSAMCQ